MFAVLQILAGVSVSAWHPASSALLADSVPEESRAEAMGRKAIILTIVHLFVREKKHRQRRQLR